MRLCWKNKLKLGLEMGNDTSYGMKAGCEIGIETGFVMVLEMKRVLE